MRLFDTLLALVGALGLLGLSAWSYLKFPGMAEGYEAELTTAASQALQRDGLDWASVSLDGQAATVSGGAPDETARQAAISSVISATGPGGLVFGGVTKVAPDFDTLPSVSPFIWRAARTPDGNLVLSGHVPSPTVKASLTEQATGLSLQSVDDRTEIAVGAPSGDWGEIAALGLQAVSELDSGQARLEANTLIVAGLSMDDQVRARLSAQVANVAEPYVGLPDIRGPSLWSARRVGNELILDGEVASEEESLEILRIAQTHFEGNIVNQMSVGGERPEGWLEGVRLALPHVSRFTRGWMGLAPGGDAFDIEGAASGSTLAYLAEDMSSLGDRFTVRIAAEPVNVAVDEIADIDFSLDPRAACEAAFNAVLDENSVTFESGNAVISRESGTTLDKIMAVSDQCEPHFIFELGGHTDSVGDRAFNIYLSEQRARAVADYMIARGFDGARLRVVGFGPDMPVAENATPEGRAANRRLEFKVQEQIEQ